MGLIDVILFFALGIVSFLFGRKVGVRYKNKAYLDTISELAQKLWEYEQEIVYLKGDTNR